MRYIKYYQFFSYNLFLFFIPFSVVAPDVSSFFAMLSASLLGLPLQAAICENQQDSAPFSVISFYNLTPPFYQDFPDNNSVGTALSRPRRLYQKPQNKKHAQGGSIICLIPLHAPKFQYHHA